MLSRVCLYYVSLLLIPVQCCPASLIAEQADKPDCACAVRQYNPQQHLGGTAALRQTLPDVCCLHLRVSCAVLPSKFDVLSKLTSLSELVLYGSTTLSSSLVAQLPRLKSLRKLGLNMNATGVSALEGLDLDFVQDLNLG